MYEKQDRYLVIAWVLIAVIMISTVAAFLWVITPHTLYSQDGLTIIRHDRRIIVEDGARQIILRLIRPQNEEPVGNTMHKVPVTLSENGELWFGGKRILIDRKGERTLVPLW